ncbi:MAG TPA: AEC family transporter, partial [Afifellaceae bacterium]|nr:AEC family transporter [Afifellaceae bacterium]
ALPFFGLIFLGYLAGRIWRRDENALAWLNIFVLYFALPALFFQLISRTPIQQLANWSFVFCTSLPPAATIYVIATQYNTYILRGSAAILLGTAASVPTVTAVLYLITNGLLPLDLFAR